MKSTAIFASLLVTVSNALPSGLVSRQQGSGTGPYPAVYTTDPSLPNHTIYKPRNIDSVSGTLPVVTWGNGGCSGNGLDQQNFNLEIASHGFVVIASGGPGGQGSTTAQMMKDSIDWASRVAGTGAWTKMNAKKIASAGWSCGGLEAYGQAQDSRVSALGIFNSGQFNQGDTNRVVPPIKKPLFYFLGGPSDIAYPNGMRDYAAVSSGVPSWNGNLPVGHGATYYEPNGGKFAKAAQLYFKWVLKGDKSAADFFTGQGARNDGWTVQSKSLDKIVA